MSLVVGLVGLCILLVSVAVLVHPSRLRVWLAVFLSREWIGIASLARVVVGIVFIVAAPDTRTPTFVVALGIAFILAGIAMPLIGVFKTIEQGRWWMNRSDGTLRGWALMAGALGAAIVWAAV